MKYWIALGLLLISTVAYAGIQVQVEGRGTTEAEARQNAFDTAITQVVGQVIVSDREVQGDQLVKDFIGGYSAGYVESFKILETQQDLDRVTVKMSVAVASSKIAQRMMSRGYQVTLINGVQIQSQVESQLAQRARGDQLLSNVLSSYPYNAFVVRADRTDVVIGARRQITINVPYEISWSRFWLDALNETLGLISVDAKSCGSYWINRDNKIRIGSRPGLVTHLTDTPCGQEADLRVKTNQTTSYYFHDKRTLELVNSQLQTTTGRQHIGLRVNIRDSGGGIVDSGCVRIDADTFLAYTEPTLEVVHWNDRSRNLRPYINGQGTYRDILRFNLSSTSEIDEMAKIDLTIEKTCA